MTTGLGEQGPWGSRRLACGGRNRNSVSQDRWGPSEPAPPWKVKQGGRISGWEEDAWSPGPLQVSPPGFHHPPGGELGLSTPVVISEVQGKHEGLFTISWQEAREPEGRRVRDTGGAHGSGSLALGLSCQPRPAAVASPGLLPSR